MSKPPLTVLLAAPGGSAPASTGRSASSSWRWRSTARRYTSATRSSTTGTSSEALEEKGAVFVENLDEVPGGAHVVFSAHGVARAVVEEAEARGLPRLDATCPLVTKVHVDARRHAAEGRHVLLIGHAGHPEVVGTMGQIDPGRITLVETAAEAETVAVAEPDRARLRHPDHVVGRRGVADRGRADAPFPDHPGAPQGGHLLRDHQPAERGQGDRPALRGAGGGRGAELVELQPAGRGRAGGRLREGRPGPARGRDRAGLARRASPGSASPPAHRPRKSWCAR